MPEFSLAELDLVDAPAEVAFDNLTRLASTLLDAPVSLVSIVDEIRDRQFFKSQRGLDEPLASRRETPLSHSFCRHVVSRDATLSIEDAPSHQLVANNPAIAELGIAAYLGSPVHDIDGEPIGALCVIDTSVRRWNEDDFLNLESLAACASDAIRATTLLKRAEALRREQRDFTYAISHDLKSPLNTLRLVLNEFADAAGAADEPDDEGLRDLHEMALATLDRADTLIENVLAYSRSTSRDFEPEEVDLDALAAGIEEDLRADIEEVGAVLEIAPLPTVRGQPLQLRMLMQNLIGNALKFSRPGVPPRVRVGATRVGGSVALSVSDEGIGIAPEDRARVFALFQRLHVDKDYAGTGLGLALCRQVAANHGGTIEITSSPGGGSTFVVRLPGRGASMSEWSEAA